MRTLNIINHIQKMRKHRICVLKIGEFFHPNKFIFDVSNNAFGGEVGHVIPIGRESPFLNSFVSWTIENGKTRKRALRVGGQTSRKNAKEMSCKRLHVFTSDFIGVPLPASRTQHAPLSALRSLVKLCLDT